MFGLLNILSNIANACEQRGIPYQLIGGLAVSVHVENADPAYSRTTKDIDLMIRRADLPLVVQAADSKGYSFRQAAGVDILLSGDSAKRNAVHLIFSEEKVRPEYVEAVPSISPIRGSLHGSEFWMAPVADLVRMKLTSFRLRDQVHIPDMDSAGLITPEVGQTLSLPLAERLAKVRASE